MSAFQGKDPGVVETLHPVHTIMALEAILAVTRQMLLHEVRIPLSMALPAGSWLEDVEVLGSMTLDAGDGLTSVGVFLVANQAEPRLASMIEGLTLPKGRRPSLRGVALFTRGGKQPLMNRGFLMAALTGGGKALKAPLAVTGFTGNLLMPAL